MHLLEGDEEELALNEDFSKLQMSHEHLKGLQKKTLREREALVKKYDQVKAKTSRDAEVSAGQIAALEIKVPGIPELESIANQVPGLKMKVCSLEVQVADLGDKLQDMDIREAEAGPKAVHEYRESPEFLQLIDAAEKAFMKKKVAEWSRARWLDVHKMRLECEAKVRQEREAAAGVTATQGELDGQATGIGAESEAAQGRQDGVESTASEEDGSGSEDGAKGSGDEAEGEESDEADSSSHEGDGEEEKVAES